MTPTPPSISKTSPQIVALKIIDLERTTDDLEDLLSEVDFQAKCFSPHLARYYGEGGEGLKISCCMVDDDICMTGSWMWDSKLTIAMVRHKTYNFSLGTGKV